MKIYRLNEPSEKRLIEAKEKAKERVKKRIQRDQTIESIDSMDSMDELKKGFLKEILKNKPTTNWHIERYISNPHGIPMKPKSSRFDDCDESYAFDYDYDPNEDYPEPF